MIKLLMVLMIVLPSLVNGLTFIKMDINEVEWAPKQVPYYDPFHDTQLVQRIPLDVSYVIEDSLPYFISFSGSGAQTFDRSLSLDDQVDIQTQIDQGMGKESTRFASSGQHQLPYQLYSDENVFFPLKEGGATVLKQDTVNGVLSLDEPSPSRLFFYMSVQPHVVVPPGRYEDIITATLYQGYYDDVSNAMFLHSTQFKVVIHVFETTSFSYQNHAMLVKSNVPYRIEMGGDRVFFLKTPSSGRIHHWKDKSILRKEIFILTD